MMGALYIAPQMTQSVDVFVSLAEFRIKFVQSI